MSEAATRLRKAIVDRVLNGPGRTEAGARRAAFDNRGVDERARALIDAVARHAWKVTDEDVAAAKDAGLSDDQIFELVVSAALGQSTRQLESALAALDEATHAEYAQRPQTV
jgi:alkylhydroperoxidase family enzyme